MPSLRERLASTARDWVEATVLRELAPRAAWVALARADLAAAEHEADALEDRLAFLRNRFDPGPFRADMTVHAAHARHPGVRGIFAARGLPGCPDCAVGGDETLAEAASAEGFSLPELVAALRGLEV